MQGPILLLLESCAEEMPFKLPGTQMGTACAVLERLVPRLFRDVAMHDFYAISGAAEVFAHVLGDHDGTVLSAGATEGDGQIAFAFMNVMGEQVDEKSGDARDEFPALRKRAYVLGEARIAPRQRAELGHKVGIGQKAHVKKQVGLLGVTMSESEAYAGHQDAIFRRLLLETLGDVSAKLVNIELGSVDDQV